MICQAKLIYYVRLLKCPYLLSGLFFTIHGHWSDQWHCSEYLIPNSWTVCTSLLSRIIQTPSLSLHRCTLGNAVDCGNICYCFLLKEVVRQTRRWWRRGLNLIRLLWGWKAFGASLAYSCKHGDVLRDEYNSLTAPLPVSALWSPLCGYTGRKKDGMFSLFYDPVVRHVWTHQRNEKLIYLWERRELRRLFFLSFISEDVFCHTHTHTTVRL